MTLKDDINKYLQDFKIECSLEGSERLARYAELVLKFNSSLNLISRVSPEREIIKQIIDSAALVKFNNLSDQNILDLGSGGGIPGLVIKILAPDIKLCSLDSNPDKIAFQEKICSDLDLKDCEFVIRQIREFKPTAKFDIITCKAFGKFAQVFRVTRQALASEGRLIFYSSADMPKEIEKNLRMDFQISGRHEYSLPEDSGKRQLIIIKKE